MKSTIDFFVEASPENSALIYQALIEFGAPVQTLTPNDFARLAYFFQMGVPPNRIDVLMSMHGIDFKSAWKNKVEVGVNGDTFLFISKNDLITTKRAAGRKKDLTDLEALES